METYAHTQVETSREGTHVDEGLLPLIEALWKHGYNTQYSCEGGLKPGHQSKQSGLAQASIFRDAIFDTETREFTWPESEYSDAHCIFTTYEEASAFMVNSIKRLGFYTPQNPVMWEDFIVLEVAIPLPKTPDVVRGNVKWAHHFTKKLIEAWSD